MTAKDPRVDAYIARQAAFARPILEHVRKSIRATGPGLVETIKWGHVFYVGRGPVCHMAAFKHHVAIGFWKHRVVAPAHAKPGEAMGALGRITSVKDLPPARVLAGYIRRAIALDAAGPAARTRKPAPKPAPRVPADFARALGGRPRAKAYFRSLSPSHQREYLEWITGAKQQATRERRMATALEWLDEGRHHNWRYEARSAPAAVRPAVRKSAARKKAARRTR